jgi:hypothetical protein
MSDLAIPIKLHRDKATLHVPMSLSDSPPGKRPGFPPHDLFGIKLPAPALNKESHAGRAVEA